MEKDILEIKEKPIYEFASTISTQDLVTALSCDTKYYWLFVREHILLGGILLIIIGAYIHSIFFVILAFLVLILFTLVKVKIKLLKIIESNVRKSNPDKAFFSYKYHFYTDYFIVSSEMSATKYSYTDISNFIETNVYLIIEENKTKKDIILKIKDCPEDILPFLKEKLTNLQKKGSQKNINLTPKTKSNAILTILFVLTILSIYGALMTLSYFSKESEIFDITEKMWILYTWLPIPVLSIVMGFKYQRSNENATKNIVAGVLISFILVLFGSFSFLFNDDLSQEFDTIMGISRPEMMNMKINYPLTNLGSNISNYKKANVKYQKNENVNIEEEITSNQNWFPKDALPITLKEQIPDELLSNDNAYYLVYNLTTNEYNKPLSTGSNQVEVIIYYPDTYILEINKYTVNN